MEGEGDGKGGALSRRFLLQPEFVQQRFGVAAWLFDTFINQRARGLEGDAVAFQLFVQRITRILRIDLGRHFGEGGVDLFGGAHAVQQPVGDMLR